ncbi:alpha/beta fold hydrolase [Sphingomonas sp. QA11]|uniref:alpha/beta fold hydrolase n=1 Tax=Sphingomonas sp. QA11 TaxID=2950605 RepID=UPI00234A39BB|nr:alpha/beta fold hydrolase [Sphingomonas sp. QA11]WCM25869.1 alpha/beta fold hydrolase [Sphingomonas sp. QA11]
MTFARFLRPIALAGAALTVLASSAVCAASALPRDFPKSFHTEEVATNGTTLHVRIGGTGPAVVLLHGYGDTGDMWSPLAADLARDHTVIIPDLRGMGLSARAGSGFEKANEAEDIIGVMDAMHAPRADVVAHDIGNMVAYALAARHPDRVTKLVLMDAPVPGVGPWDEILKSPLLWHFRFGGPDMERLVAGRERIYLDRFWNEFSADPANFPEAERVHYAELYAAPGRMHAGFRQFAAFDQDAVDNRAWLAAHGKLTMPVLAIGGEKSFGPTMAVVAQAGAVDVEERVISNAGHWLMEEQPAATVAAIDQFLNDRAAPAARGHLEPTALSLDQTQAMRQSGAGAGTSGLSGIRTVLLYGDPAKPGPYMLEIHVPPNTRIAPHTHRDDRFANVISGSWYFGYGAKANDAAVKPLTAGGLYTEPGGTPHFAFTRADPAVVRLTGMGPSDTVYVAATLPH